MPGHGEAHGEVEVAGRFRRRYGVRARSVVDDADRCADAIQGQLRLGGDVADQGILPHALQGIQEGRCRGKSSRCGYSG